MTPSASPPRFSVIVPVLREQGIIVQALADLLALAAPGGVEVVLVDGSPGRETLAAAEDLPVVRLATEPGRAVQMNAGAALAQGEALVFLHADTRLPEQAFFLIAQALMDPGVVGGAFALAVETRSWAVRLVAWVANVRSRLTRVPYGDQAQFFRRDFFQALGGYPEIPIMEDVEIMRRAKRAGAGIAIIREPVRTSARRWDREGVLCCTVRNWLLRLLYYLGAAPERLARWYGVESRE